jgi:hypothetical protein
MLGRRKSNLEMSRDFQEAFKKVKENLKET